MVNIIVILGSLAAIFQFMASYFAWRIYEFNRLSKWWLALVFAFFVQGVKRIFNVLEDLEVVSRNILIDRSFIFVISLFIVIGLYAMLKNFENFDIVCKVVDKKLGNKRK